MHSLVKMISKPVMLNSRLDRNVTWPARTTCTWCHFTHPGWKVYVLEFFYLRHQNIISIILTFQSFLPPNYWPLFVLGGWKSPLAEAFFSKTILHFPSASSILICLSLRENIVEVKLSLEDRSEYLAMFTFCWKKLAEILLRSLFVCVCFLSSWLGYEECDLIAWKNNYNSHSELILTPPTRPWPRSNTAQREASVDGTPVLILISAG